MKAALILMALFSFSTAMAQEAIPKALGQDEALKKSGPQVGKTVLMSCSLPRTGIGPVLVIDVVSEIKATGDSRAPYAEYISLENRQGVQVISEVYTVRVELGFGAEAVKRKNLIVSLESDKMVDADGMKTGTALIAVTRVNAQSPVKGNKILTGTIYIGDQSTYAQCFLSK